MSAVPLVSDLTTSQIHDEFLSAADKLTLVLHQSEGEPIAHLRVQVVYNTIQLALALTESSNGIPCLRGLGLENSLLLAQKINSFENLKAKDFGVHLRVLADSVSL